VAQNIIKIKLKTEYFLLKIYVKKIIILIIKHKLLISLLKPGIGFNEQQDKQIINIIINAAVLL